MFPKPMPIHHDAKLFPCLFGTNRAIDVPYLLLDSDIAPVEDGRIFDLEGNLCFSLVKNLNDTSGCIQLYNQTAGWFALPETSSGPCHSANASWVSGWWPAEIATGQPPRQPKWAPYCQGINWGDLWPWTGCQSRTVIWANKGKYFTFSPGINTAFNNTHAGHNFSDQNPFQVYPSNPFDNWLLCGINGSYMNLEPMVMMNGGSHGVSLLGAHPRNGEDFHQSPLRFPFLLRPGIELIWNVMERESSPAAI